MIKIKQKGDYSKISKYLSKLKSNSVKTILEKYGAEGVGLLEQNTPIKSGKTARSWTYDIEIANGSSKLNFRNTNINDGVPIAIIIQYGHGTGTGGYVEGIDYINPPIQKLFEKMSNDIWKEVSNL